MAWKDKGLIMIMPYTHYEMLGHWDHSGTQADGAVSILNSAGSWDRGSKGIVEGLMPEVK